MQKNRAVFYCVRDTRRKDVLAQSFEAFFSVVNFMSFEMKNVDEFTKQ